MNIPMLMNGAGTAKTVEQVTALAPMFPAIMLGSFTLAERTGNPGVVDYSSDDLTLNVRGIPSPAVEDWQAIVQESAMLLAPTGKQLWVSVAGFTAEEFAVLARAAMLAGADLVELNFGCPNMTDRNEGGFAPIVSYRPVLVRDSLAAVRAVVPVMVGVKLSPVFDQGLMGAIDRELVNAGNVAYVAAINTVPYCMVVEDGRPVISFGDGLAGMSGPAVKPIGLGQVAQHRRLLDGSGIPIVGVGGVITDTDVADYLAVGAVGCQMNSALQPKSPHASTAT